MYRFKMDCGRYHMTQESLKESFSERSLMEEVKRQAEGFGAAIWRDEIHDIYGYYRSEGARTVSVLVLMDDEPMALYNLRIAPPSLEFSGFAGADEHLMRAYVEAGGGVADSRKADKTFRFNREKWEKWGKDRDD